MKCLECKIDLGIGNKELKNLRIALSKLNKKESLYIECKHCDSTLVYPDDFLPMLGKVTEEEIEHAVKQIAEEQ